MSETTDNSQAGGRCAPALGSAPQHVLRLWVAEYEDRRGRQWRTVVEAYTQEAAKRQFRRDNPDVELLTCY